MASATFDFVIVGGGICGVAAAYELAGHGSVALIEQESHLSYHTTGRSAAISMSSYGNATIRRLTTWSTEAYKRRTPPFSNDPVWSPRGAVILSDAVSRSNLQRRIDAVRALVPNVETLGERGILELAPYLRPGRWVAALYEPDAFDLDVHAIHSSYVKGLKHRRGAIFRNSELVSALRHPGGWDITLADGGRLGAGVLVNAAGAWADQVAAQAGVAPCGVRPLRRTVVLVDPKQDFRATPYVGTVDEDIFIKPQATGLLVSPCDETLSEPCDAIPETLDIAIAMARFLSMTSFDCHSIRQKWAGLRTFVADRTPIVGADPTEPSFVWSAAVGGYGIQAGPAIARLCAAAALGHDLPAEIAGNAIHAADLSPERYRFSSFLSANIRAVVELH